jgi:hypothetical protein
MTVTDRRLAPAVAVAVGILAAACSSGAGDVVTTGTTRPVTVATPPTTTSTTVAVSDPTTSTTLSDEEAVRLVHTRFMTELFARDERIDGPEVVLPLAEELTTGAQLARIQENVQERIETGERVVSQGYESHIIDVLIEGERASVLDCSRDQGELFSAEGDVLLVAPDQFMTRETRLIHLDGQWLIDEFVTGGSEACDPED